MLKASKVTDTSASVAIKKRSNVPGVMITQFVEELPKGSSTPDFIRKPIALTIQEGKLAVFKAIVTGIPTPTVTWARNNGDISDPERYQMKHCPISGEHTLEMPNVSALEEDVYKCFACNEFGKAVVTATLNVIEVGFNKSKALQQSRTALREKTLDFKKLLKTRTEREKPERKQGELDEKVWEILLSADKKDYERICMEYGITDFRGMLKRLNELKREREEEQAQFVEHLSSLKHIEVKANGCAEFEITMDMKDPNSRIFLYKNGEMIEFSDDISSKHSLKKVGKKYVFSVKDLDPDDAGLYQVDVEGVNIFSTEFKAPPVEFLVKIQEVTAMEREDAVFECLLSKPFPKITWVGKNVTLQSGDKYDITVSEDMLIHRLLVKDCMQVDKGIYAAIAGIKSCNAWLIVEADKDAGMQGKKKGRKSTQAGGAGLDLEKMAREQQAKLQTGREEILGSLQKAKEEKDASAQEGEGDGVVGLAGRKESTVKTSSSSASTGQTGKLGQSGGTGQSGKTGQTGKLGQSGETGQTGQSGETGQSGKTGQSGETGQTGKTGQSGKTGQTGKTGQNGETGQTGKTGQSEEEGQRDSSSLISQSQLSSPLEGQIPVAAVKEPSGVSSPACEADVVDKSAGNKQDTKSTGGKPADAVSAELVGDSLDAETPLSQSTRRSRAGPLVPETLIEKGVHFICGLSDVSAILGQSAEMVCKLSNENCDGVWYKDGKQLTSNDVMTITKEKAWHKLTIKDCREEYNGKYRFEAEGHKTEAQLVVKDPPRFDLDELGNFSAPVVIKVGQNATFKIAFVGREPMKVQWYKDGEELVDDTSIKVEKASDHSRLLLGRCQRKDSGEIKIKVRNEFGTAEACTSLIVLDKPKPPQAPVEIIESSAKCIEIKWRHPKDDGGSPVTNYVLERQQLGRNSWKKLGEMPANPTYRDTDVTHGRKYCYRICAQTAEGVSDMLETDDIMAGNKAYPGPPAAPEVVSAFKDCINLSWVPPANTGDSSILGYNLEKRKKGSNLWTQVNPGGEPIQAKKYAVKDVVEGLEYEFRVAAINMSGTGEPSSPSEFVFARDPIKPPGKVVDIKVTDSTYNTLSLAWTRPPVVAEVHGEAKGYFVEIRPAESIEWSRCKSSPVTMTSFVVIGLRSMAMYWVRVIATNEGGSGEPQELDNYILAMPPPVKPRFTDAKMKNFIVIREGNSARVTINFEASPLPDIMWMKDGMPLAKRVTVTNAEGASQLLIPSSERSDTGVYTIIVKNLVGQETCSVELRVTDDPKPPGTVEVHQNVPGTLTVSWAPSPDEKRDDRLHYMVSEHDSSKRTWQTVGDRIFNSSYTAVNILPGREYSFRVYAKNDMGVSEASLSAKWAITKKKDKFVLNMPEAENCNFQTPPKFLVPLKMHSAPQGYECYMSCAVRGNPEPRVTWYRNNVSLNTDADYHITNTCGVCSLLILRVGPKSGGEYKVMAENRLGRAESSTMLTMRE